MMLGIMGGVNPQEMRKQRLRQIIDKSQKTILDNPEASKNISREFLDDGNFLSKYLDQVNTKQFQQYFCQYNPNMFAQLLFLMKIHDLQKSQFLFTKDQKFDDSYFFLLKGKIELVVPASSQEPDTYKFAKNIDEGLIFTQGSDFARAATDKCEVVEFSKSKYENIIKSTQMSSSEKKVDFLYRYVPKIRHASRKMIEEFEVFFIKEEVGKGYQILKQDEQDDYLYFIYKGKVRLLLQTGKYTEIFGQELLSQENRKQLILGYQRRGEHFGEQSAFNDIPNPYTIEAITKVELYKIHRSYFIQYFGGLEGEPLLALRGSIILKQNWMQMKLNFLKSFTQEQITKLDYRNDEEYSKLKPTKQTIKEIPYLKNNPQEAKLKNTEEGAEISVQPSAPKEEEKTEKQKRIEALKASLLAPMQSQPNRASVAPVPGAGATGIGMNRIDRGNNEDNSKFNKVMDWGTPRLVTKQLNLNPTQMASRTFLTNLAQERKGILNKGPEEKKGDFAQSSVMSFREKMLREEKMSQSTEREKHEIQNQVSASNNDEIKQKAGMPGGLNFFQKLKNTNEEEAKEKIKKSSFKGLPI